MPEKFLSIPVTDLDVNDLPTVLTNGLLHDTTSLSGLPNDVARVAFVLQNPSPEFTPVAPPSFYVQGTAGPYYIDPSNVPSNTEAIRYKMKFRFPTGSLTGATNTYYLLAAQESQGFDVRAFNNGGTWNLQVQKVEDGTGATMISQSMLDDPLDFDTWYTMDILADQAANELVWTRDGGAANTVAFSGASNGVFQSTRELSLASSSAGSFILPVGVEIEYLEIYLRPVGGSESLHKRIDATNVNTDPWKAGTDATGV